MQGFDNAKGRKSSSRMSDFADMVVWPEGDYGQYRPFGPVFAVKYIWFTIATERKPEGVPIPKICLDHDGATDSIVDETCPYRLSGLGRESSEYYVNVIDRAEQEGRRYRPIQGRQEEHLGYMAHWLKAGDSRLTPVRLLNVPDSQVDKLKGMKRLNKVKNPRDGSVHMMDITHPRFGCDIGLLFDKNKKGPARYDIQKGDRTPMSEEELGYGIYRPDLLKPNRLEEAKRDMEDLAGRVIKKSKGKSEAPKGGREDDPLLENSTSRMSEDDLLGGNDRRGRMRGEREPNIDDALDGRGDYGESRGRTARGRDRDERDAYDEPRGRGGAPVDLDSDFDAPASRGGGGRGRSRDDYDEPRGGGRETRGRGGDDYDEPRSRGRDRDDDRGEPRGGGSGRDRDDYYDEPRGGRDRGDRARY